jgi:hypothetical protein
MSRSYTSSPPKRLQCVERDCFTFFTLYSHILVGFLFYITFAFARNYCFVAEISRAGGTPGASLSVSDSALHCLSLGHDTATFPMSLLHRVALQVDADIKLTPISLSLSDLNNNFVGCFRNKLRG